jgi:hypothetical protein
LDIGDIGKHRPQLRYPGEDLPVCHWRHTGIRVDPPEILEVFMGRRSTAIAIAGSVIALSAIAGADGTVAGGVQERAAPLPVSAPLVPVAAPATLEMFMYSTPGAPDDLVVS